LDNLSTIQNIAIWSLPVLFAITVHEAAHGYVAWKFGDNTAKDLGRISLNPLKHIDIMGTVLVPIMMLLTTGFVFGWAKPVPVNPNNLKNPKKRHMAYVAIAGPLSNFFMALFWIISLKLGLYFLKNDISGGLALLYMGRAGVIINLVLMILNLIPIPPLDGSKVLLAILPKPWDLWFHKATPFGLILVVALMVTGVLAKIMMPILNVVQVGLFSAFGLS
jgi:Zn-dependent protease